MEVTSRPIQINFMPGSDKAKILLECGHTRDWDFGTDPDDYVIHRVFTCFDCQRELKDLRKIHYGRSLVQ